MVMVEELKAALFAALTKLVQLICDAEHFLPRGETRTGNRQIAASDFREITCELIQVKIVSPGVGSDYLQTNSVEQRFLLGNAHPFGRQSQLDAPIADAG